VLGFVLERVFLDEFGHLRFIGYSGGQRLGRHNWIDRAVGKPEPLLAGDVVDLEDVLGLLKHFGLAFSSDVRGVHQIGFGEIEFVAHGGSKDVAVFVDLVFLVVVVAFRAVGGLHRGQTHRVFLRGERLVERVEGSAV